MSKTGAKALKEMRRRLDRIIDPPAKDILMTRVMVEALVTDAEALDELGIGVVVQPYKRHSSHGMALEVWDIDYPEDVILSIADEFSVSCSIERLVDQLLLRAAKRLIKVEVKTHEVKGVSQLPTDRPDPG